MSIKKIKNCIIHRNNFSCFGLVRDFHLGYKFINNDEVFSLIVSVREKGKLLEGNVRIEVERSIWAKARNISVADAMEEFQDAENTVKELNHPLHWALLSYLNRQIKQIIGKSENIEKLRKGYSLIKPIKIKDMELMLSKLFTG